MIGITSSINKELTQHEYDQEFFDDMYEIFLGLGHGQAGKYMYDSGGWEDIIEADTTDYYVPRADSYLLNLARDELPQHIPFGTPYIDFGVGGAESIQRYAAPIMRLLGSPEYNGVDCDQKILDQAKSLEVTLEGINVRTHKMDFFNPPKVGLTGTSSFGVMNGVTLGNMYGSLFEKDLETNLANVLKGLSVVTNHGWLLISIDSNQDKDSLLRMYKTPLNSRLNIASIPRAAAQLPMLGFNPDLFQYEPEWMPEQQLVAHIAIATQSQNFMLGNQNIIIQKGQKLHLFNSYKFRQEFFESSARKAGLTPIKFWRHETGVMLYLLRDNLCPVPLPSQQLRSGTSKSNLIYG